MSNALPVLTDGDRLEGQACTISPGHSFCDLCDCVRRHTDAWRVVKDSGGYPVNVCGRHEAVTDEEIHRHGFLLMPGNERLLAFAREQAT